MNTKRIASILIIMTSITWACTQSDSGERKESGNEESTQVEQIQSTDQVETASGEPDAFGRLPGDAHYGHDHPPQDQQQANPTQTPQENLDGGPDAFGRSPGDEHYGHSHE